jgi:hypothetical protein
MRDENNANAALDALLGEFDASEGANNPEPTKHVTFWISAEHKTRYDAIQARTGRRFSKKLRELIQAAIELAEKRAG